MLAYSWCCFSVISALPLAGAAGGRASAQEPAPALPHNYKLEFQNAMLSVLRVHYGPHEKIAVHDHSRSPTVYVYLSNSGPVRFQHYESAPFTSVRPPTVKGSFRVSPGRLERHSVENLGNSSSDFLRVELKKIPLGGVEDFRGPAPPSLAQRQELVLYQTPALAIERILCVGAAPCPVHASAAPSLLIAVTPLYNEASRSQREGEKLEVGSVRWLPAGESSAVKALGHTPAYVLRLLLPLSRR